MALRSSCELRRETDRQTDCSQPIKYGNVTVIMTHRLGRKRDSPWRTPPRPTTSMVCPWFGSGSPPGSSERSAGLEGGWGGGKRRQGERGVGGEVEAPRFNSI